MTIDVHTHYLPEEVVEMLRARTKAPSIERRPDGTDWFNLPVGGFAFTEDYVDMVARLEFMDTVGVDAQLLSFAGLFGADSLPVAEALPILRCFNDHAAALSKAHPAQFGCLADLPFDDMDAAVAEYRRARTELGLLGAILPINYFLDLATAERIRPIFDVADELGGHLFLHPGPRPDQRPDLVDGAPPAYGDNLMHRNSLDVQARVGHAMVTLTMTDFLSSYSGFSLHVANLGGILPAVIERLDHMRDRRAPDTPLPSSRIRGLYVDCSSLSSKTINLTANFLGADRIMLGTDCPIFDTDRTLAGIEGADLTADEKAIRHTNAARLLADIWPALGS
jgi:predicted TIM-barrel fold metal-dependent hydrolase